MKTTFEKKYVNFGCYGPENFHRINTPDSFDINHVLSQPIPLMDKLWFIRHNCELTDKELRELAIGVTAVALPFLEAKRSNTKIRIAIQAAKDYLNGTLSWKKLSHKLWDFNDVEEAFAVAVAAADVGVAVDAAEYVACVADEADAAYADQLRKFLLQFLCHSSAQAVKAAEKRSGLYVDKY